jgi:hypothetical protein
MFGSATLWAVLLLRKQIYENRLPLRPNRLNNLLSIEVDTFSGPKFYEKGDFQYEKYVSKQCTLKTIHR